MVYKNSKLLNLSFDGKKEKFKAIVLDKESEEIKESIVIESLKKELQEEQNKGRKEEQKLNKLKERLDSFDYKKSREANKQSRRQDNINS